MTKEKEGRIIGNGGEREVVVLSTVFERFELEGRIEESTWLHSYTRMKSIAERSHKR